ncbi:MAG TPA: hypothetical protein VLQ80_13810, partial [Candidatus Saccharimonadia bacterium]|nr:hypothetical protein [Candidatus Saccharimonadia bacterium]
MLSRAIELYRAMAMPLWLPEAEAALAQGKGDDCGTCSLASLRDFSPQNITDVRATSCYPIAQSMSGL